MIHSLSRRRFLEISGLAGGLLALRTGLSSPEARASTADPQLLLHVYFSGGWDQLLVLDPRPNDVAAFQRAGAYAAGGSGIYPAYDVSLDAGVRAVLAGNPSGVQTAGGLTFGPAVPSALLDHAADLSIVRGVSMDTLTHEVGRRYFLTGKFPRGVAANGSSLATVVAGQEQSALELPNLAVRTEGYNEGWPAAVSPIRANSAADVLNVLRPIGVPLAAATDQALREFESTSDSCEAHAFDQNGLVSLFRASRGRARSLTDSSAAALFNFNLANPPAEVKALFDAFQISTQADLAGPRGRAALAAQALARNISQAVALEIADDLDDHADWDQAHATTLRGGLEALGRLISFLKASPFRGGPDSVWKHTTLVVFSEFARTPLLNGRDGRDHHLASSCLLAGPGLRPNVVVGGTTDKAMAVRKVNLVTGAPDDAGGALLKPSDVHATVLKSMGLSADHLSNQSPQVVQALLR